MHHSMFAVRTVLAANNGRSRDGIKKLLFVSERQFVYCERRTEFWNAFMNPRLRLSRTRLFSLSFRTGNAPLVCVLPALPISLQNWTVLVGASRLEMNRLGRSMTVGWRLHVSLISPH